MLGIFPEMCGVTRTMWPQPIFPWERFSLLNATLGGKLLSEFPLRHKGAILFSFGHAV